MSRFCRVVFALSILSLPLSRSWAVDNDAWKDTGGDPCSILAKLSSEELIGMRKDFKHNTNYTFKVPTTDIRDQCRYGSCWIFSAVADLEGEVKNGPKHKELNLSEQYVIIRSLQLRSLDALEVPGQKVDEGGYLATADWLIENFGIVPDQSWVPRIPFDQSTHPLHLMESINNYIGRFHLETAGMPRNGKAFEARKAQAQKDLMDIIGVYSGPMPEHFEFEGKKYSPKEFAAEWLPKRDRVVGLVPTEDHLPARLMNVIKGMEPTSPPKYKSTAPEQENLAEGSTDEIAKMIATEVQKGRNVPLAFEVEDVFFDKDSGVFSVEAFHRPHNTAPLPRLYRGAFGLAGGGHLVDIVGVDVDAKGNPVKFLIKNSWGTKVGDKGFNHMYRDYFDAFMMSAYVTEPPEGIGLPKAAQNRRLDPLKTLPAVSPPKVERGTAAAPADSGGSAD